MIRWLFKNANFMLISILSQLLKVHDLKEWNWNLEMFHYHDSGFFLSNLFRSSQSWNDFWQSIQKLLNFNFFYFFAI
jgi:hypothetical protein